MKSKLLKVTLSSDLPEEPNFPLYGSFKYDGVRGSIQEQAFYMRSLKPVVNRYIQSQLDGWDLPRFDGELIIGKPNETATFRRTTSGVRDHGGEPDFKFYVFDIMLDKGDQRFFRARNRFLQNLSAIGQLPPWIEIVKQTLINNMAELFAFNKKALDLGYEGIVLRDPECLYKHGRATEKQGQFMRMVPWARDEAVVIGMEEQVTNNNPKTINELGRSTRSTHKENMVPNGKLGAFLMRHSNGMEFKIGNGDGMTHEFRETAWSFKDFWMGKIITYRHKTVGGYDKPRQAQYVGIRSPDDLGGD